MAKYKTYTQGKYQDSEEQKQAKQNAAYWGGQQLKPFDYHDFDWSDATKQAQADYNNLKANEPIDPGFTKQQGWDNIVNQLENVKPFTYDVTGDALYQQYKDQYMNLGKMASADVMGQAAAMTGGYGNSYAQSVGQQAYQGYLQQLNDKVPELYQLALAKYNSDRDNLYRMNDLYQGLYNTEHGKHRENVADRQNMLTHYANMIGKSQAADSTMYTTNRDTDYKENDSQNGIVDSNRTFFADLANQLATRDWGQYTDRESIAAKAIDMYNYALYKEDQTRIADAKLALEGGSLGDGPVNPVSFFKNAWSAEAYIMEKTGNKELADGIVSKATFDRDGGFEIGDYKFTDYLEYLNAYVSWATSNNYYNN